VNVETTEMPRLEPLIFADELRELLRISKPTMHRLMREGEIPFVKVGRRTVFEPAAVREYLARHRRGEWLRP
jgi:excisionase family DNA binding protein